MKRGTSLLWTAVVLLGCTTARQDAAPPGDLGAARERWQAAGIEDYRFDFQQQCFCVREQTLPVTIEVRDGAIARVVVRETGEDLTAVPNLNWPTVPGLFQVIADANASGVTPLEVEYDAERGYPRSIEAGSLAADAGVIYTASGLEPLAAGGS